MHRRIVPPIIIISCCLFLFFAIPTFAGQMYVCSADPDCPNCPSGTVCADVWTVNNGCCHHTVNHFACVSQCQSGLGNSCNFFCQNICTPSGQCTVPFFPPASAMPFQSITGPDFLVAQGAESAGECTPPATEPATEEVQVDAAEATAED